MTMQVGMVGTDGVLIASDTLWMNTEDTQYASVRHTSNTTKIEIDYRNGVGIACARNMELAGRIAKDLLNEFDAEDWGGPDTRAVDIANKVLEESSERRRDFQCTIVTAKPEPQLFQLHHGIFHLQKGARCQLHSRKVFAGDTVNSAVFWGERFYSSWEESLQPIHNLIPLAAHIIFCAGKIGRGTIGGLEIAFCDSSGIHRLSEASIKELEYATSGWDAHCGETILGHKQQFTYAPHVIG